MYLTYANAEGSHATEEASTWYGRSLMREDHAFLRPDKCYLCGVAIVDSSRNPTAIPSFASSSSSRASEVRPTQGSPEALTDAQRAMFLVIPALSRPERWRIARSGGHGSRTDHICYCCDVATVTLCRELHVLSRVADRLCKGCPIKEQGKLAGSRHSWSAPEISS
jgi:hypothetical protein